MRPSLKFSSQASSSSPLPVARPYTPPYMESPPPTPSSLEYHTDLSPWLYDSDDNNMGTSSQTQTAEKTKTTDSKPPQNGNAHPHLTPQSDMASSSPSSSLPHISPSEPSSPLPHLSALPLPPRSEQDRMDTDTAHGQPMPRTPTRTMNAQPQYPYTPQTPSKHDAANAPLRSFSPMPWSHHTNDNDDEDENENPPHSPLQSALLSCLTNLGDLIQDTQPSGSEMEYLIRQFERISSYLTRDRDQTGTALGLGINLHVKTEDKADELEYFGTVDKYIAGVKAHAAELKDRLDEVRELNRIQWDVICELRAGQKKTAPAIESAPEVVPENEAEEGEGEKRGWRTFWGIPGALGSALDMFGEELMEW